MIDFLEDISDEALKLVPEVAREQIVAAGRDWNEELIEAAFACYVDGAASAVASFMLSFGDRGAEPFGGRPVLEGHAQTMAERVGRQLVQAWERDPAIRESIRATLVARLSGKEPDQTMAGTTLPFIKGAGL